MSQNIYKWKLQIAKRCNSIGHWSHTV